MFEADCRPTGLIFSWRLMKQILHSDSLPGRQGPADESNQGAACGGAHGTGKGLGMPVISQKGSGDRGPHLLYGMQCWRACFYNETSSCRTRLWRIKGSGVRPSGAMAAGDSGGGLGTSGDSGRVSLAASQSWLDRRWPAPRSSKIFCRNTERYECALSPPGIHTPQHDPSCRYSFDARLCSLGANLFRSPSCDLIARVTMVPLPVPGQNKPLKILTIDGGGLQAISTLLILDELLSAIAKNNGVQQRKPRPCDVFDTIAGIGAGGWLALLLGRFHMDITSCLSEWYKITQNIAPRSGAEEMWMRLTQHCYFNPDRLVDQVDRLTKIYGTGEFLFADNADSVRTRHVFVAALRSDAKGYNLFRTYPIPASAKLPKKLLEGPVNPETFKISRAFGVTGAARYFTPHWKEQMATSGKITFSDTKFPKPHNITELALDEMWGIYGIEVPLSVIVNIGPGIPNTFDVRQIARRFSWGVKAPQNVSAPLKRSLSPPADDERKPKKRNTDREAEGLSVRFHESADRGDRNSKQAPRKGSVARIDTFGSVKDRKMDVKLKRDETNIELDVKKKLDNIYKGGSELYYRLALEQAPQGTTKNDSSASGAAVDATIDYLHSPPVGLMIDEIAQRMPKMNQRSQIPALVC